MHFDEFTINFVSELLQFIYCSQHDRGYVGYNAHITGDGVALPAISTMGNAGCVGLHRWSQLSEHAHRKPGGVLDVMSKPASIVKQDKGSAARETLLEEDA
jgi:chitin synthase